MSIPKFDNRRNPTSDYITKIAEMTDAQLVEETSNKCWLSAFANNNPRSDYHWQTDALYAEAARREKPWLYQRGWNSAYRSAGYEPDEGDLRAAQEPSNA